MRAIIVLTLCVLSFGSTSWAQDDREQLPASAIHMLNRRFPGWKLADVSAEVRQFFKDELKGASPVVIYGDFDGNGRRDYAVLIHRGYLLNNQGQAYAPQHFLVVFLRRNTRYKMYVIKDPAGDYLSLAKKGTRDYNYTAQKEIIYENDAIVTGIFEKAGSSYVYKNGRFISFVSSD